MNNANLTAVYNSLAATPVKKFADLATAEKRTLAIVEDNNMVLVTDGTAAAEDVVEDFGFAILILKPIVKTRSHYAEEDLISVNTSKNPKRKGTLAEARFALLLTDRALTIGEYLDACHALQDKPRYKYLADIRWDLEHGHISLDGTHNED